MIADSSERNCPSTTEESAALVDRICAVSRLENRAAAAQLVAIGELFSYRLSRCSENEDWAIDTMEAVAAEVGAALRISQGLAASRLRYARAMRERLPKVGDVFQAGNIDFRHVSDHRVSHRSDRRPRADGHRRCAVGRQCGALAGDEPGPACRARSMRSWSKPIAMRCAAAPSTGSSVRSISASRPTGCASFRAVCCTPTPQALDKRLNALAATVCPHDPRTRDQRRADALGALAAGADRLGVPVWPLRLCRRHPPAGGSGGDPCDRRASHPRRRRTRDPRSPPTG